jgi:hypothetical protein
MSLRWGAEAIGSKPSKRNEAEEPTGLHREFCTLFDSNYLFKALAMYESLERHCASFTLTACCFDDQSREILEQLKLPNMRLLSLEQLELADPEFAATKPDRSPVEYCWTATAPLTLHVLESRPEIGEVTYLDADLLFFADPELLFSEIGDDSICITPHRFSPEYERHIINGIYCVQWVTFKRDARGLEALRWWRERCIEWCYYRMEDGKLGDQKYLDDWPERFEGVCDLSHPGGGLAPWNISQYELSGAGSEIMVDGMPLVFFHYHRYSLSRRGADSWQPPGYVITPQEYEQVYAPYAAALERAKKLAWSVAPRFDGGLEDPPSRRDRARLLRAKAIDWVATKAPWAGDLRRRARRGAH